MAKTPNNTANGPSGRDPLGIGVPYYGESSFDPVEFVRSAWAESGAHWKEDQANIKLGRQKAYDDFIKKMPNPEAWEIETSQKLQDEALQITRDFQEDVLDNRFNPMGSTSDDLEKKAKYDQRMATLKKKSDLYKAMKPKYDYAYQQANDVTKQDLIDRDLTKKRLDQFYDEADPYKKAALLATDLIVFKPKPVEVLDELSKAFNAFVPDLDKKITREDFNESTGLLRTETMEKMNPEKLDKAMGQVWNSLSDRVQNEFKRRYEAAPASEKIAKVDGEDINMDLQDWFKSKYSPGYAEKMGVSYSRAKNDLAGFDWGIPGKDANGKYLTEGMSETKKVAISKDGKSDGEIKDVNAEAVIPLQGAFKTAFQMPNTISSFDANTGLATKPGTSAWHIPDNIAFMPVATEDIYDPANPSNKLVRKGDLIPADVHSSLIKSGQTDQYVYDAFLTSITSHKQISAEIPMFIKGTGAEDIWPIDQYSMSHTTITPWKQAEKYVRAKAVGLKLDPKPLENFVNEHLQELNSGRKKQESKSDEELYESLYQ